MSNKIKIREYLQLDAAGQQNTGSLPGIGCHTNSLLPLAISVGSGKLGKFEVK